MYILYHKLKLFCLLIVCSVLYDTLTKRAAPSGTGRTWRVWRVWQPTGAEGEMRIFADS